LFMKNFESYCLTPVTSEHRCHSFQIRKEQFL